MSEPMPAPRTSGGDAAPSAHLDPGRRQALLESMSTWLDEVADAEAPPAGLAPDAISDTEPAPDLYSFLAQLAALTRETQLQGRATNRLHADLSALIERLGDTGGGHAVAKRLADARREARLELLAELLDARDRFARGLAEARRRLDALRGLRAWLGQRPVLASLVEGNALALDRLDDALRRLDVHEIPCVGQPFDPRVMRAVEVAAAPGTTPGTVLEVFRAGYASDGRPVRFAEVKVAGQAGTAGGEHG
jgi:molecular chaperone GrpE